MNQSRKECLAESIAQPALPILLGKSISWIRRSCWSCCALAYAMTGWPPRSSFGKLGIVNRSFLASNFRQISFRFHVIMVSRALGMVTRICSPNTCFPVSVNVGLSMYEEGLQRSCGAFLACMDQFAKSYPEEFVNSQRDQLMNQILGFFGF